MTNTVRTRVAPSPTGAPHIGTAYIALHNYAFAKSQGGQFLLRIEDTDQTRSTPESERQILDTLSWLGLHWDEGPGVGGPQPSYRQSERLGIYQKHAEMLLAGGKAYRCFCSKERLDDLRQKQMDAKAEKLGYDGHCRALPAGEADALVARGVPHVVRLKVKTEGRTSFYDHIRREDIAFENSSIDDQVLLKADGFPTYHLANVVDDHLMGITDVLRGEEWISSTPKHVMLYEAFGWECPRFRHLPLLRNLDKSKISKRKNPTSLLWFMARGYTREALLNFLGLMGYSMKDGREFFPLQDLVAEYDAGRLSTTAPIFDFVKLDRINGQHVSQLSPGAFLAWQQESLQHLQHFVEPLFPEIQRRCKSRGDLNQLTDFLFERELRYNPELLSTKAIGPEAAAALLQSLSKSLAKEQPATAADIETHVTRQCDSAGHKQKDAYMILRAALMNSVESLPLMQVMEFLGPHISATRCKEAADFIKVRSRTKTPSATS